MKILVKNVSKRFKADIIVQDFSYTFRVGCPVAVTGANGSGKSTLLKILAGAMPPAEGNVSYVSDEGKVVDQFKMYQHLSMAAPYIDVIEEYTLQQLYNFYSTLKPMQTGISLDAFADKCQFGNSLQKVVGSFSSGMKQRLKLGLALFSDTDILLLDEPTANLDSATSQWYLDNIIPQLSSRVVIVASNLHAEYSFCDTVLPMASLR